MRVVLGSRNSRLALRQSGGVADLLRAGGCEVEIREISTRGDQRRDLPFQQIGAPGVFVRELERALLRGEVDVVVHSYKDLPSLSPAGLVVAAVPERRDAADRLLALPRAVDKTLAEAGTGDSAAILPLVEGARVGTASARRRALLLDLRPDLEVGQLRGNVPTRLDKLRSGEHDAIVLAAAGLERLGEDLGDLADFRLDPSVFIPAPSQGALAVQVRESTPGRDAEIHARVAALDDAASVRPVSAERRLQALIEGGCQTAFGAWCRPLDDGRLRLDAALDSEDGVRRGSAVGEDPLELAARLLPVLRGETGRGDSGDG